MERDNDTEEKYVTMKQFLALRTDVKAILGLLEGSKRFGLKGLPERVNENEQGIKTNGHAIKEQKQELTNFKTKIIAYTAGAAGTATAIIQIALSYFT